MKFVTVDDEKEYLKLVNQKELKGISIVVK
jgi:hypothetical protein